MQTGFLVQMVLSKVLPLSSMVVKSATKNNVHYFFPEEEIFVLFGGIFGQPTITYQIVIVLTAFFTKN